MSTRRIAINAVLAAMCAALGALSLDFGSIKITLESLPIIIGALLFGAADGFLIGLVGTFIYQVIRYGLMITTPLWMIPYAVGGLLLGLYAAKKNFEYTQKGLAIAVVLTELFITAVNTVVLYADSMIYGYYYPALITGMLIPRIIISFGKAVIFALIMPPLLKALKRAIHI